MGEAIYTIVGNYVRPKDRVTLERMREHRSSLLQNYRIHAVQGFRVQTLEKSLQEDVVAIDDALSRLRLSLCPMRAVAKCGRTLAPRLPQALQTIRAQCQKAFCQASCRPVSRVTTPIVRIINQDASHAAGAHFAEVIFCGRMTHDSATGAGGQIIHHLGMGGGWTTASHGCGLSARSYRPSISIGILRANDDLRPTPGRPLRPRQRRP
jgi:hypothetical protein